MDLLSHELFSSNLFNLYTFYDYLFLHTIAFNQNISNWNVVRFTNMSNMFLNATSFNQNIGSWNVSNVTSTSSMLNNANVFAQDISGWNVGNVTNMSSMFQNADAFNIDISSWNVSNVTNMSNMFNSNNVFNRDLSNWDVSSVTNMEGMFQLMPIFNSPLNWGIKTGNVTNMRYMFFNTQLFNQDINSWNVSNVTNFRQMFHNAYKFNQSLANWQFTNKSNKTIDMDYMFYFATSFNQDISSWNISRVTKLFSFLAGGKLSRANYDALLLGWSTLDSGESLVPINLNAHFGSSKYSNESNVLSARNTTLIANKNWTITDGGMDADTIVPFIVSSTLASNNATISITFSENVYRTDVASGSLEVADFLFSLAGGTATLNATIPSNISFSDNLTFVLGIDINGTPDGTEVLIITPVLNSIFDVSGNAAATTQSNNTVQLNDFKYPIITGPSSTSGLNSTISINENNAAVHTFSADEVVTWSLGNTNDEALLSIDSNGNLVFNTAPDFETPASTLNSNTYVVEIIATDAANNATSQTLTITILDIANSTFGTFAAITKQYFNGTHTLIPPTTNNSNPIVYSSDNLAVATVSGSVITFTGVGTANITATQATDANYEGNSISTLLTVLGKDLVSKYGGVSSTDVNYISANGSVGGAFGIDKFGKKENATDLEIVSLGLIMHLDTGNPASFPGSGSTWTDLSGNGNHGVLQNGVGFSGINNGTMVFDGINDYVATPIDADLQVMPSTTWTGWIKTTGVSSWQVIFGMEDGGWDRMLIIEAGGLGLSMGHTTNRWQTGTFVTPSVWQYVVTIYDNGSMKFYLNGIEYNTAISEGNHGSNGTFTIGSNQNGVGNFYSGNIAQVSVYNRVLSTEEIQQNFNADKLKYGL